MIQFVKRILTIATVLVVGLFAITLASHETYAADEVASGTCGDDLTWTLDSDGLLTISGEGNMYNYSDYGDERAPWYSSRDSITEVIIENGVTSIGQCAFDSCIGLTSIDIPDSVTSIESWALNGCRCLMSITIPAGVTSIGSYAFYKCSELTSITIPDGVASIEGRTFSECSSLKSITIPGSVTSIGESAFDGCTSLTTITLPEDGVTSIGWGHLRAVKALKASQCQPV